MLQEGLLLCSRQGYICTPCGVTVSLFVCHLLFEHTQINKSLWYKRGDFYKVLAKKVNKYYKAGMCDVLLLECRGGKGGRWRRIFFHA